MAYLPFYADRVDIDLLIDKLNSDSEIAFIISTAKRKWSVVDTIDILNDGDYYLWHISGGRIRVWTSRKGVLNYKSLNNLFRKSSGEIDVAWIENPNSITYVEDPFKGWKSPRTKSNSNLPALPSQPSIISLSVQTKGLKSSSAIGLSDFGWIGNRYSSIGWPAAHETTKWWKRLNYWMSTNAACKIPRSGPLNGPNEDAWALPSAFAKLEKGTIRESNPY